MDRYSIDTIRTGELLCERNVPFAEIVASLHLYEESAYTAFPKDPAPPLEIYTAFDKLSHIRMILLADAYFRSASATAGARIQALERQATLMARERRTVFHGLVGSSPSMRHLYDRIEAAAATRGTILIVGESGTGKELVARAIHECGAVPMLPFVALNCAAIPKDLIESELFGYRKGAFSGANADYLGLFRAAEGRHAVSRRSYRDGAGDAEQALARRAGTDGAAGGLDQRDGCKRTPHCVDQSRSRGGCPRRQPAP